MKTVLMLALMSVSLAASANEGTHAAAAATTAPAAKAHAGKKVAVSKMDAKKACKAEGKTGKDLKGCVKEKMEAAAQDSQT